MLDVLQVTFIELDKRCCEEGNDLGSCQIVSSDPSDAKQRVTKFISLLRFYESFAKL
jgi:hypothetical protein